MKCEAASGVLVARYKVVNTPALYSVSGSNLCMKSDYRE
jgi:hypothetical protein